MIYNYANFFQIKIEEDIIERLNELTSMLEVNIKDQILRHTLIELVKVCIFIFIF